MVLVKQHLPDSESLIKKLDETLAGNLPDFLTATQDRREAVKGNFRFALAAVLFILAIFIFLFLTGININDGWFGRFILSLALLWMTVFLVSGRAWFMNTKLLAREMNMSLAPIFSHIFDRQFMYTNNQDNKGQVFNLLQRSSLITTSDIFVQSDDSYYVYGERPIEFHELVVTVKTRDNQSATEVELFKGLLVVAKLAKSYEGETYVSTEGDRSGFAHKTFWSDLLGLGDVEETILEWNDFEKDLHIATSDPVAAREILTPEFMSDLHAWWNEHKLNIRIAFKGDQIFILMPEATIHIASSTTSAKLSIIKRYAVSLVRPMWRSMMLVEDVSR